jgi:hypothetical protein
LKLVRGGLNDSVDVASARVRLLARGTIIEGCGSSFSTSDVAPSLSDDEDGDEHDEDSRSPFDFGATTFIFVFDFDAAAVVETVELCESNESFANRSRQRTLSFSRTNPSDARLCYSFSSDHGMPCRSRATRAFSLRCSKVVWVMH